MHQYDVNGDQTSGTINGETRTITYSSFNKPLVIPTIKGNTGFTSEISVELREAPYEQLDSTNLGF